MADARTQRALQDYLVKLEHDLGMPAKSKDHLPLIVQKLQALSVKLGPDTA